MIRALTVSVLFAVLAIPAYAQDSTTQTTPQDNPQTRQTDQSEDDYRRSQRRRDTGDIFEDIDINRRGTGAGGNHVGREVKAIDRLDQESRRHLNKQRAKALAEANPGESIDAAYEPSETAKTDEYVAKQEQKAWEEMMREANSGLGDTQGQGTGQGQVGSGQPGQAQQGQSGQGQVQAGQGDQSGQRSSNSPLRGGSASSASSILDRIKGRTGAGTGTAPQAGQTSGGGQASADAQAAAKAAAQTAAYAQAQAQAASQAAEQARAQAEQSQGDAKSAAEAQAQSAAQAAAEAQVKADASAQAAQEAKAQAAAEAQTTADAQAAAEANANANANAVNAAAEAAAHHDDTMSPLERLKRDPVERGDTGGRTSASDYLNRKKN